MTFQEIQEWLERRPHLVCHSSLSSANLALQDLCGLVNGDDRRGEVLFGIDPERKVRGIKKKNVAGAASRLERRIWERFNPPLFPIVEVLEPGDPGRCRLIRVRAERKRTVPLHEYRGRAYIREGGVTRALGPEEKQRLERVRRRELHVGSWRCDTCGEEVSEIAAIQITEWGLQRSYRCSCGGEFYPA